MSKNLACNFPDIPDHEFESEEWIQSDMLSYSQWELLKPYYTNYISVPQNELNEIKDIFPEIQCILPNKKELKKYQPWKRENIKTFYEDYPFLRSLSPILSFNKGVTNAKFNLNSSLEERFKRNSISLDGKGSIKNLVNITAKVNYQDSIARWKNRSISFIPTTNTSITVGNFNYRIDNGLNFGYLYYSSKSQRDPLKNWLYTNNRQWNGIKLEKQANNIKLTSITHVREKEILGAIKFYYEIEKISFHTILSADLVEAYDSSISGSFKLKYNIYKSEISLSSLINSRQHNHFPFELNLINNIKNFRNNFKLTFMPHNFSSHRSSAYKLLSYRLSENPTEKSEALLFRNEMSIKPGKKIYSNYSTTIAINDDHYYLKQELEFNYSSRVSLFAKYRLDKSNKYLRNYLTVKTPIELANNLIATPSFYAYLNDNNYYRYKGQLSIKAILKSLTLQPSVYCSKNSKNEISTEFQLLSKLKISTHSTGKYQIIYKPKEKENGKIKIYLGQTFYL